MIFFRLKKKNGFWGILGQPYYGIGTTIRISQEMICLPYAGFFSESLKKWLNTVIFRKHHLEEIRDDFIKKVNKILIGKTHVERNAIYYFYQN